MRNNKHCVALRDVHFQRVADIQESKVSAGHISLVAPDHYSRGQQVIIATALSNTKMWFVPSIASINEVQTGQSLGIMDNV